MRKERISCTACGAKNDPIDLCRICGSLLPGALDRRREGTGGAAFHETVEQERARWRDYEAGRMETSARSRRPESLPDLPTRAWHAPADDGFGLESPDGLRAVPEERPRKRGLFGRSRP